MNQRKSIRLKNYDYSSKGLYFVTICVQNKAHLFGYVENDKMVLNPAGEMVQKQWFILKNRFQNIDLDEIIVMPNHLHSVVAINPVGAPLVGAHIKNVNLEKGQPQGIAHTDAHNKTENSTTEIQNFDVDIITGEPTVASVLGAHKKNNITTNDQPRGITNINTQNENLHLKNGQPQGIAPTGASLGNIVGAFKSITTFEYIQNVKNNNWPTFNGKLWQRNYYEHIIRTHDDYLRIVNYIINNPKNWNRDSLR